MTAREADWGVNIVHPWHSWGCKQDRHYRAASSVHDAERDDMYVPKIVLRLHHGCANCEVRALLQLLKVIASALARSRVRMHRVGLYDTAATVGQRNVFVQCLQALPVDGATALILDHELQSFMQETTGVWPVWLRVFV